MRLLGIELYKIWHNKTSRLLMFGYFLLIFSIAILSTINVEFGPIKFNLAEQGIFNFPYIWHFNTFIIALLKIFFAIVIVAMIGNEYSYKTIKQNLIDGMSKGEFLKSKVYTPSRLCWDINAFSLFHQFNFRRDLFRLQRISNHLFRTRIPPRLCGQAVWLF